ncbi:MAG TPA: BTAD domain-containing putative transcriptional regulator [Blastocatellia bacterium]|nr:BTAD domain-containing putative transcriptional regulator [Blastocatellia bacterium]
MLPQLFLKTKLLPPRLGRQILPRPRLIERMHSYLDGPATIVCANAGCGKTTVVADFIHSCSLPSVWYQIDASDQDLGVFFAYLVYGLRGLHPEFGQAVLGLIRETEDLAARAHQLADVFVNEILDQVEEKTILVMDDFHNVDASTSIGAAVDRLMQYVPDVLHIVITSRTMPNLSISRLRSKGLIGIIDRRDLLFVAEEVHQLFAEIFRQPLPPDLINQFYEKTEGWITALQLIQQSLARLSDDDQKLFGKAQAMSALQQSEIDIFDYFAEEVLQAEPPETRMTLGRLSLFERISPDVLEAIFRVGEDRDNLRALARRNVFVARAYESGSEEEYRLHPLFRSFLKPWLAGEVGADEVRRLHNRCAEYFADASQWDLALDHYAEAGATAEMADLLARRGAMLFDLGRFEVIKRAFESVPQESFIGRERALIARADVAMVEGDHALASTLYVRAAQLARESGDDHVQAESLRGQAYIARHAGEYDEAMRLSSAALDLGPDLHSLRGRCFNIIGLCRFTSAHDTRGAVESWRAALAEARQAGDDRFARIVLHNLGLPYSLGGNLNEAVHLISQMIGTGSDRAEGAALQPSAPFPQEAIAHLNLGRLKMAQGRLAESESHLELALQRCRMFNLNTLTAETLEGFGNLYRERGDYARSLDFYNESARAYADAGLSLTERELLDERASLYLQMGQLALAERDAQMYYEARQHGSAPERVTALVTHGRVEMTAGRPESAEQSLVQALELANAGGIRYYEARAATSLARLYWDCSRRDEALAQLRRAAELSLQYDYSYWLSLEAAQAPVLFDAAIQAGIAVDYLSGLRRGETSFAGVEVAVPTKWAAATGSPIKPFELVERPGFDLTINMLGPIQVYRSQAEPMPEDTWRLLKSLHILCYIASRRNHRAPKDTVVELFWPEAGADTIAKNFHPTISHVRKALNRNQVVKKDFILYREGAYSLNPQYRYQVDTEGFERLLGDARELKRSGDVDSAAQLTGQAIALYRGDFLEELYYQWTEELKGFYRDLYLEGLKELAEYYSQRGEFDEVIRYGQMILQRDPYREDVHCRVMEALVGKGNRAAAIEQFDKLRKMLRSELGVAPLPATVAKYEALIK